jgi:hypothetical protein
MVTFPMEFSKHRTDAHKNLSGSFLSPILTSFFLVKQKKPDQYKRNDKKQSWHLKNVKFQFFYLDSEYSNFVQVAFKKSPCFH